MNRKNICWALVILCCSFMLTGCSKEWLNEKADVRTVVPQNLDDFQGLLDNVTNMSQQFPQVAEIAADVHYITDAVFQSATKNFRTDAYIWSRTLQHLNVGPWNQSYTKILCDNIILEGLNELKLSDSGSMQRAKNIRGQALMHRARAFFELAQIYAPAYDALTADKDLGIVLKLQSDINAPSVRSTVKQTYEQIVRDLEEAFDLLPAKPAILTRGSRVSAAALLSRVYLTIGDYEKSLFYASESLSISPTLINFNKISKTATFIGRYNIEVLLHTNYADAFLTTSCLIERPFYDSYATGDLRKVIYFRSNTNGTITFKGNYEANATNLFNGLATDEMYLNRAECYARLNKKNEAMADLNTLMRNRWDSTTTIPVFTATDAEDALRQILGERKKELVLRNTRWMDLRRLNKDTRFAVTLTRVVSGTSYTLAPNATNYTFPIPDDIIALTGIPQNKGWEK